MTTINSTTHIVLTSLDNIEREIRDLRRLLGDTPEVRRSLRGSWRGVQISDEDVEEAKRSWTATAGAVASGRRVFDDHQ